jgi:release factor glutamine methyltransferase
VDTDELLREGKRTLVAVNERFGWQGDEDDQAWDILVHAWGGHEPDDDEVVPPEVARSFQRLVKRRTTGEPLAFILGWVDFLDFRMDVKAGMFVPRLTSEFLAKQAIRRLLRRRSPVHVDLATGIGPVAIGVAKAVPKAKVFGVDISRKALAQAEHNARKLGVRNARFLKGDMFSPLPKHLEGAVDVVTIHPPYVPRSEVADLPVEIKKFEPTTTLTDRSPDGLGLVRRAIEEGYGWLKPGGWVLIEIVPTESAGVRRMMREAGYTDIRSTHGELKLTRVIVGRKLV